MRRAQMIKQLFFLIFLLSATLTSVRSQDLFKTPSGAKYHLGSCRMVKNVSEKITLDEAEKLGLGPCGICLPQTSGKQLPLKTQIPNGQSTTTRCKGITKAGTRCEHMTSIANGYCFQHKP